MTRRLSSGRTARSARPVIDAHGHLLVPEANALADGHPGEAADAAAERASFTEASITANQAQIRRVWPQLTDVDRRWPTWTRSAWTSSSWARCRCTGTGPSRSWRSSSRP